MTILTRYGGRLGQALLALALSSLLYGCGDKTYTTEEHIQRAKDYVAQVKYKEAFIELRNVLKAQPNHPQGNLLLAETILKMGNPYLAEVAIKKAKEVGVSKRTTQVLLARALLGQGRFEDALQEAALDPKVDPLQQLESMYLRGEALMGLGRLEPACAEFAAISALRSDYAPAMLGQSRCAAAHNDFVLSRKLVNEALRINPKHTESWVQLGHMERGQGRFSEAESAYGKAVFLNAQDVDALLGRAMARLKLRNYDGARKDLLKARAVVPSSPMPTHMLGVEAYYKGDYREAKIQFQKVLNILPEYLPSIFWQGLTDLNLDNVEQAAKSMGYYVTRQPDNQTARVLLAYAQARLGNKISAEKTLKALRNLGLEDAAVLSMSGQTYLALGKLEEAQRYLREALEMDPKNVELKLGLAESYRQKHEYDDFLRELNEAVALQPTSVQLHSQYIQALIAQDKKPEAQARIADMRKLFPKSTQPLYLAAFMALKAKDTQGARRAFEEMLTVDPISATAYMNLARMDLSEGKVEQGKQRFLELHRRDAKNYTALIGLAAIHYATGDLKAQREWLEKAVRAKPKALEPLMLLAKNLLSTGQGQQAINLATQAHQAEPNNPGPLHLLANIQEAVGAHENARSSYTRLSTMVPNAPSVWFKLGQAHDQAGYSRLAKDAFAKAVELSPRYFFAQLELARMTAKVGEREAAQASINALKAEYPKSAPVYLLAGDIYFGQKQLAEALKEYQAAMNIKPSMQLIMRTANVLLAQGKGNAAENVLREWLKKNPRDQLVRLNLATFYAGFGKHEAALQEYEQFNRLTPDRPEILNDMAWLQQQRGDLNRGLALSEKSNKLAPNNPAFMDTLGWILLHKGEQRRALGLLEQAAKLAPNKPDVQFHYATALASSGQLDEAKRVLRELLKNSTTFKERAAAEDLLKRI
jgi:putative PEP-CTERM system TPR-repeat lipoprotein